MSMSPKPSSSFYPPHSLSSGSSESQLSIGPGIGRHKWVRLLALAFAIYLLLLPVWWYCLGGITLFAANCADLIYHIVNSAVLISADGRIVNVSVGGLEGDAHRSALNMSTVTYGLPMLAALVLATGSDSILAKARALLIGTGIVLATTVPAVLLWA